MPSSPLTSTLFPYTTLFRSPMSESDARSPRSTPERTLGPDTSRGTYSRVWRSEEHTSELQSLRHLVCRLHHLRPHSFPTRRSSDLLCRKATRAARDRRQSGPWVPTPAGARIRACGDRKSTRLNSSHLGISYAVFTTYVHTLSLHDALPISYVGKRRAQPEIDARADLGSRHQQGHVFARVVGAGDGGVAAVIGGEDNEVVGAQRGLELGQPGVEQIGRGH